MLYLVLAGLLVLAGAHAQEAEPTVQVSGVRNPALKPYKYMLSGMRAFDEKRALAPTAPLRFVLQPRTPEAGLQGLSLKLENDTLRIPIALDADLTFELPRNQEAADTGADLTLNRKAKSFTWFPYIRSAGLKDSQRRLGDLRLACAVHWATDREGLPFMMRNTLGLLGPCTFSKFTFWFVEPKKLAGATLVSGERRLPLRIDGMQYLPPLHDKSWNDDSLVELEFAAN